MTPSRIAGAVFCLFNEIGLAQSQHLPWPAELPDALLPTASPCVPKYFDYVTLPVEGNFRDALAISMIRNALHREAAAAWIDFIRSDTAAAVYDRHGFDYAAAEERTPMEAR